MRAPGATTAAQIRSIWPKNTPAASLLRELAALLLEDPDNRLRVLHAEALLQHRLPGHGAGAAGAALESVITDAHPLLHVDRGLHEDWHAAVVRLDVAALEAAAAAAAQQAGGTSAGSSEDERLEAAILTAWPNAEADDQDYLAAAIAGALLNYQDAKGQLPRHTLHLTDVGSHLRTAAASDPRLAAIFPRNRDQSSGAAASSASATARRVSSGSSSGGSGKDAKLKPRLSEFVGTDRCSSYFRVIESQARKGEKALVLLTGALLANLADQQHGVNDLGAADDGRPSVAVRLGQQSCDGADTPLSKVPCVADTSSMPLGMRPSLDEPAAPLWAPFSLGTTLAAPGPAGSWAAPITPECQGLLPGTSHLQQHSRLAAYGSVPRDPRMSLGADAGSCSGSGIDDGGPEGCFFGSRQQGGMYGSGLFGSDGGGCSEGIGIGTGHASAGARGGRVELEPVNPGAFGGGRWGSGIPIGAPSSSGAGVGLPALQPLVGSFSMGTGLGLGTLLRGFGTDADGGGMAEAPRAGSFGAPGVVGDTSLFGPPPGHSSFGTSGSAPVPSAALDSGGPSSLFSSSVGAMGLGLGPSAIDLVPRAIASVWGPPDSASPVNPATSAREGRGGGTCTSVDCSSSGSGSGSDAGGHSPAHEPGAEDHNVGQPAQSGHARDCEQGQDRAIHQQQEQDDQQQQEQQKPPEDPGALINHSSSSGMLSLRGIVGVTAHDSSVPDTEGSISPLSATGSEAQPGSGLSASAQQACSLPARPQATAAAAAAQVCSMDGAPEVGLETEVMDDATSRADDGAGSGEELGDGACACGDASLGSSSSQSTTDDTEEVDQVAHRDAEASADADGEPPIGGGAPKTLTGWALVAAKTPPKLQRGAGGHTPSVPRSAPPPKEQMVVSSSLTSSLAMSACGSIKRSDNARAPLARLHPGVKEEVERLVAKLGGIIRFDDFDEGVAHQLNSKKTWEEAADAVRHLANYDLASIQHPAAYINHIIKHYNPGGAGGMGAGAAGASGGGAMGGQIRLASVPISTKAMLHKCGPRVYRRVEEAVASSSHLQWHHFDAGVVKVLAELARLSEEDVFDELAQLQRSDLKSLQHVPAYLNKRLNNRLWQRRKARGD